MVRELQMTSTSKAKFIATFILPTITFLAGLILGPGFIWELSDYLNDRDRLRIENANAVYDLSTKLIATYNEIIILYHDNLPLEYATAGSLTGEQLQKKGENDSRMVALKRTYEEIENQLAEMTDRKPRPLQMDFIPPSNVRMRGIKIVPQEK